MNPYRCLFICCLSSVTLHAQQPQKWNSAQIYNSIEKLNFLGSALYIAAHPDDENTNLITFLSNTVHAETAYLSLTRGDGGQNLIGTELREKLGVIRTQELLQARKIDGGIQFFSRANDFGFSKHPNETLRIWNKAEVKEDMIWVIRNFQPDIIITRFDHRTPGATHGHHTTSALLTQEVFEAAADPNSAPNQLKYTQLWKPEKLFLNISHWFYPSLHKFEQADKSKFLALEVGSYYPNLGLSNQEIAALSRSRHQSQGFGTTGSRGAALEYLEVLKGNQPLNNQNLFSGINTTWSRIPGGAPLELKIKNILNSFNYNNPQTSVKALVDVYQEVSKLPDSHWKKIKSAKLIEIIVQASGVYIDAYTDVQLTSPNSKVDLVLEAINRSNIPMQLYSNTSDFVFKKDLKPNVIEKEMVQINIGKEANFSTPYWLNDQATTGMYAVEKQENIGKPDIIRDIDINFNLKIFNVTLPIKRPVVYKYNDAVKGERYEYLDVVPPLNVKISESVVLFNDQKPKKITVDLKTFKKGVKGQVALNLDASWTVEPIAIPFDFSQAFEDNQVHFLVTPPKRATTLEAKVTATVGNEVYTQEIEAISYDHIPKQHLLKTAQSTFKKVDIQSNVKKIGYLMGAGDVMPQYLGQIGVEVQLINTDMLQLQTLQAFDAVVLGVRAYNVLPELDLKKGVLFEYMNQGGTLIVQYNTSNQLKEPNFAPFPLHISKDRVTDEDAEVTFLKPDHKVLNYPNKIDQNDFKGWVQEQGLYYPDQWDSKYETIISAHDPEESPKDSAILIAKYGKGHYIYTGLSFFRQLPAGVTGAYKLFANMLNISK